MLRDITIEDYRLFREFSLDSLARVNLIVGPNSSGKSSLLEAIYLLSSEGARSSLLNILDERGELVPGSVDYRLERGQTGGYQIAHIFYGHQLMTKQSSRIQSELDIAQSLTLSLAGADILSQPSLSEETALREGISIEPSDRSLVMEYVRAGSDQIKWSLEVSEDGLIGDRRLFRRGVISRKGKTRLITTSHLGYDELAGLWDDITLTPREERVIRALQILEPRVRRISFTSRQTSNSGILLKLIGEKEPVPLGSMGDGMRRILAIAASLISVGKGTLLVDEIDTGLHYEVLADMWRLVTEIAHRQSAQVFATTHSWDCVRSFQEALSQTKNGDRGLLIRLEQQDGLIRSVSYSKEELGIAIQQGIEVR